MNDSPLYLHELSLEVIKKVNSMKDQEKTTYFLNLISRFYPTADLETKQKLLYAYNGSFYLEEVYREVVKLSGAFTAVYTRTGLIRELVNDIYFMEEEHKYQIN